MCCGAVARCASYEHDTLPQHLVCNYELNCEYSNISLARHKAPWWWSDKIETCRSVLSVLKVFCVKLYVLSLVNELKRFMSFPCRTQLVAESTIFGTRQAVWKERLWVKSVLEENIPTLRFTTGGSLRLLSVGIFIQSSGRQASGKVLQLPARKLYWCRLHFSSVYLVGMYCIITEDHKRMWVIPCPLQCTVLQWAS
jgi:hypothetical protein